MPKVHLVPEHVHVQDLPDVLLAIVSIHVRVCSELLANVRHFLLDAFGFLLLARAVAEIRYKDGEAAEVAPAHSWGSRSVSTFPCVGAPRALEVSPTSYAFSRFALPTSRDYCATARSAARLSVSSLSYLFRP